MKHTISPPPLPPVMLVEDEPALRAILTFMLEDLGAVVTSFATAAEGLAALSTQEWALVVTDVRTPGPVDGLALATTVRARLPAAGVIVMSGFYEEMGKPLPMGVSFLPKPWPSESFDQLVMPVLEQFSKRIYPE
ncbi:response regulator [Pseudomonas sp. GD04058]|uniref:response regulator n=1 Tax=Pseudomonas sp. GD04058 TaxID=2975429 RepID=UPI00244ADAD2|nr:response regulator [Pseudomonas sp. GD04058]MDG9886520.1 response regulator [Pseudomonas sp. GD04058]